MQQQIFTIFTFALCISETLNGALKNDHVQFMRFSALKTFSAISSPLQFGKEILGLVSIFLGESFCSFFRRRGPGQQKVFITRRRRWSRPTLTWPTNELPHHGRPIPKNGAAIQI